MPIHLKSELYLGDTPKLTVNQVEERARYLDALDQGHAGNLLPLQSLVATAVERSFDLEAGESAG